MRTGIPMDIVFYKSAPEVTLGVAGGEIAMGIAGIPPIAGLLKDGRLRAIGWTGVRRVEAYPSVPTVSESGVPGFVIGLKAGFHAHKATPPELVQRLSRDLSAALAEPDVVALISAGGARALSSTPEEYAKMIQADIDLLEPAAQRVAGRGK